MKNDKIDLRKETEQNMDSENDNEYINCGCNPSQAVEKGTSLNKKPNHKEQEIEEEETSDSKVLIILGIALTIPLVIIEVFLDANSDKIIGYVLLALATPVQILLGRPFYIRFYDSLRRKRGFTIDTLVVLSTSVAFFYSVIAMMTDQPVKFFEASASVLTIFTIGEYLEGKVLRTTSESIEKLIALRPKTAVVIRGMINDDKQEEEYELNIDDIMIGDIVVVKPGETVATDGVVVYGESSIDESMITGESIPIDKRVQDEVIGGTINKNGYLRIKATNVGSQTVLANIVEMVKRAKKSKPSIQRIADTAAMYFIPVVFSVAIGASIYWALFAHASAQFLVTVFATVLVVSCPCALGIATPMVVSLGVGKAAKQGVLIKGGEYLEKLAHIDTVVFDKTGTLTSGKPEVTDVIPNDAHDEATILRFASSAEVKSEHPIAQAIVHKASKKNIQTLEVSEFNAVVGQGVIAKYLEKTIFVGNPRTGGAGIDKQVSPIPEKFQSKISELESEGKTVVTVVTENSLVGLIAVADTLRNNAIQVVHEIKSMGKQVILLSGDREKTAIAIAKELGIEYVLAQVTPDRKTQEIQKLQIENKKRVAMIGDGINDAPALTQADVGIAMGSGTDIAMAAGHVILMKNDLSDVIYALRLGEYSLKKIKQNLVISFAYNSITIPIAAGILYPVTNGLILTPALAALGWIISDSAVFGNSMSIRRHAKKEK